MMANVDLGAQGVSEEDSETVEYIKERIWQDPLAADLQWSLFLSAMGSYRYDTVLRPFPPMFQTDDNEKDHKSMQTLANEVTSLTHFSRECYKFSSKLLELIKWVLDSRSFTLSSVPLSQLEEIQRQTGHSVKVPDPNFIFQVIPSSLAQEKFEHLQNGRGLLHAYHGSRLENFHSILHNGLASHMNKTSVFGEGTYLSGELSVSLIYSPTGVAWDHSELGNRLSCVAVCEMIDDSAVKCQNKPYPDDVKQLRGTAGTSLRSRANAGPSEGGEVPEKYYVVQNNEVIRVKYLLVYADKTNSHRSNLVKRQSWVSQHKFMVMMFMYAFILCAVGLFNSQAFRNTWRRIWRSRP